MVELPQEEEVMIALVVYPVMMEATGQVERPVLLLLSMVMR